MIAIVDTGPLVAVANRSDPDHARSLDFLERTPLRLIIPTLVVAEAAYLIATRLGPSAEARFLAGLARFDIECPLASEWQQISELALMYVDFPLGAVDASVVSLAERLATDTIVTFDHRHFRAIRPRHVESFQLLPDE
jgi:uncharacterized protein